MNPLTIIQAIEALSAIIADATELVQTGKAVLSETDTQAIHAALLKAEAATAAMRPQVDAALSAAAAK